MSDEADYRFKLILLGNIDVGKTSLILRFTDNTFSDEIAGEIDMKTRDLKIGDKTVKLIITDTAGQERFRTLTSSYYRNADAIIVVYDVTDQESFGDVDGHIAEGTRYSQRSEKFLVGNKVDLSNKVITTAQGKAHSDKHNITFFETSAKEGTQVEQLFQRVASKLVEATSTDSKATPSAPAPAPSASVEISAPKKKKGGCDLL
eukprot:TRINITY_DN10242_c0_g1_i1.p1 TRINITY_DN10242_c0_g1~~TRINITY_DN10242_c0_g1_i1.p1  ORF type:complete len:204 (+),score=28.82 TRINITY_DN10242_c0_g1_i1:48-659(+)